MTFFTQKNFTAQKPNLGKSFFGPKIFPDFGAQIDQQHFFIIWQDSQTPHQSFFTNVSPNDPIGNQSIFGSQNEKKNSLSATDQIGNIVVKNFQHVFRQSAQIRLSYFLDIGDFFCTKKFYGQKTKFGKIVFWA